MTLFNEIKPIIENKKDIDIISINLLNNILKKINKTMFIHDIEIYTYTSIKTLNDKKIGIRSILIKCNDKKIDTIVDYNLPSYKNRQETSVLINALQIARFLNNKIKANIIIYNNSEYALDFITKRKYVKNTNMDLFYFFNKTNIKEIDTFVTIKKIHRKDNINKLYCKEICQIKYIK